MRKMKIGRRVMAGILLLALTAGAYGCGNGKEMEEKTATDIPDYSSSEKRMNMYAHISPTPGSFVNASGQTIFLEDHRTVENYQDYKDCGFDTLFLQGNDAYTGENFETSDTKKNMDRCQEVGLKCIVFDNRIWALSKNEESLIGEGKEFSSLEDLADTLKEYMAPYIEHPAFYGVATFDEPHYKHFEAMGEVTKALKMVKEDIYVKTTCFPYLQSVALEKYTGEGYGNTSISSYRTYIDTYLEKSEADFFNYDNYPFKEDGMLDTYFLNMQTVVNEAAKYGAYAELCVQSCAIQGSLRMPDKEDLYYQNNAALAFGIKNLIYFTYWMAPNRSVEAFTGAIVDDDGTKLLYDEVQEVNAYTQEMAKVILNFEYEKAYFTYDSENAISAPIYFSGVKSEEMDDITEVKVTQPTIITQMKDAENNRTGYMVLNAQDTIEDSEDEVTLTIEGFEFVTCYFGGKPQTIQLDEGSTTFTLGTGKAVFVIPHN